MGQSILESIIRAANTEEGITRYFEEGIVQVMRPFKPGKVYVYVANEPSRDRTLITQVGSLRKHPCTTHVDILAEPYDIVERLIESFKAFYADLYVEPESHIQLGYN